MMTLGVIDCNGVSSEPCPGNKQRVNDCLRKCDATCNSKCGEIVEFCTMECQMQQVKCL